MIHYIGEFISLAVAMSWTFSALFFEYAGKKIGSLTVNFLRLFFAFFLLGAMLFFTTGSCFPAGADTNAWIWMILSGLVGFVFGDLCLFYSYTLISARFSQLLMTLAPPFAAFFGWLILNEKLSIMGFAGMMVTLFGIAISVLKRGDDGKGGTNIRLHLPLKGIMLGIGAALGQGLGIVLSKKGMNYYDVSAQGTEVARYIPFAATQIRIIAGIFGFALIIILGGRTRNLLNGLKDKNGMKATFAGAIFGPFVGVSLSLKAIQYTNTAIASTIMAITPITLLIPYAIMYKKKIKFVDVLGAVLSVAGVALFFM